MLLDHPSLTLLPNISSINLNEHELLLVHQAHVRPSLSSKTEATKEMSACKLNTTASTNRFYPPFK